MKFRTLAQVAVIFAALFFLLVARHQGPWKLHQFIGLAILLPSFLLWGLARYQLGEAFSVQAKATRLVTHGLYSKIRSPIYLFGSLAMAGIFVYVGMPYLFLLFVLLVPMQVARARREESVLRQAFPQEYAAYKLQTWF